MEADSPSQAVYEWIVLTCWTNTGAVMEMRDRFTLVLGFELLLYYLISSLWLSRLSSSPCPICSPLISFHLSSPHLYSISLDENYSLFISSELFCCLLLFLSHLISTPSLFISSHLHSFSILIYSQHFSVVLLSSPLLVCIGLISISLIFVSSSNSSFLSYLFISFHRSPFCNFISSFSSRDLFFVLFHLDSSLFFSLILTLVFIFISSRHFPVHLYSCPLLDCICLISIPLILSHLSFFLFI